MLNCVHVLVIAKIRIPHQKKEMVLHAEVKPLSAMLNQLHIEKHLVINVAIIKNMDDFHYHHVDYGITKSALFTSSEDDRTQRRTLVSL